MNRETARRLIASLRNRCARNPALASALRRDADRTPAESRIILEWAALFHTLGVSVHEEATCHLVAILFAHDRSLRRHGAPAATSESTDGDTGKARAEGPERSLGSTMAACVREAPSEEKALARRLTSLLAATIERDGSGSLPWRLRRTVMLLHSKSASIDWERLAYDVSQWSHPEQFVQREWARDFYKQRPLAVKVAAIADDDEQADETTDTDD